MQLEKEQKVEIFKRLAYKSTLEVGREFGFDQHYKDNSAIRMAVMGIYRTIKESPEKYGVAPETKQIVLDAMAHRHIAGAQKEISKAEKEIDSSSVKEMVTGVRDKSLRLLDLKLTRASKSRKSLDAIPLRDLTIVAGTMFDKSQILLGQATEHVAIMGKIEGNINPQDALDLVLKMREQNVAQHASKK